MNSKLASLKTHELVFVVASLIFNIAISALYLAVKFESLLAVQILGTITVFLSVPFTYTLIQYRKENAVKKVIVSHFFILFYFFIEILLDYILKIPFRDILALHIPYIIFFYAASFSMIGVSFRIDKKLGFIILTTFFILIACLVYLYM